MKFMVLEIGEPSVEFWATLIGAAVGVVAGAFIQYLVEYYKGIRDEKRQRAALKKELQYNLHLIHELKAEAKKLRDAVNGDALSIYYGYLNYNKGLFAQSNALLNSGLLYKWFTIEQLKMLQAISFSLNVNVANFINDSITSRRETAKSGHLDKVEAVQFVTYIDAELDKTSKLIDSFILVI